MASYRQSAFCPKFGTDQGQGASSGAAYARDNYPHSYAFYGPQAQPPNMETKTGWNPYGGIIPREPYFGGYDGLGGRLMHVPQADLYNTAPNPWPANGVDDQPNARFDIMHMPPSTSAHPGWSIPTGPSPAMIFHAPPIFGVQTVPIPAFGV
jgi:hypothetical protein